MRVKAIQGSILKSCSSTQIYQHPKSFITISTTHTNIVYSETLDRQIFHLICNSLISQKISQLFALVWNLFFNFVQDLELLSSGIWSQHLPFILLDQIDLLAPNFLLWESVPCLYLSLSDTPVECRASRPHTRGHPLFRSISLSDFSFPILAELVTDGC